MWYRERLLRCPHHRIDGLVDDLDAAILAQHWMMTVENMEEDDERDAVFATIGATDDALGLFDE